MIMILMMMMMIGLSAYDRIHDGINRRRPRQLGKQHVLRQADGRWRAPHTIPAAHRNPPIKHLGLGHTAQTMGRSGKQLTPPHSLPVPPARLAGPSAHCLRRGATLHPLSAPVLGL